MTEKIYNCFQDVLSDLKNIDPLNFKVRCSDLLARAIVWEFLHDPEAKDGGGNLELALTEENKKLIYSLKNESMFMIESKSPENVMDILCYMNVLEASSKLKSEENVELYILPRLKDGETVPNEIEIELNSFFKSITDIESRVTELWRSCQAKYYSTDPVKH